MTQKEKAEEIVYNHYWLFGDGYLGSQHIQHALIAVDEILKQYYNLTDEHKYWQQVKNELNSML